ELAAVRRLASSRWGFGRVFRGRARRSCGWFLQWQRARNRRFIYGPSSTHFGRPLSEGRARHRKQHCQSQKTGRAARSFHFAFAAEAFGTLTSSSFSVRAAFHVSRKKINNSNSTSTSGASWIPG